MNQKQKTPAELAVLAKYDREIQGIMGDLSRVADTDYPKVKEEIFVGVFLPFFAGDADANKAVNFGMWMNVAHNGYRPVNVVNELDEVLFTVPPVLNRQNVRAGVATDINTFSHIAATTQQYAANHPQLGKQYMASMIAQKQLLAFDTEEGIKEARIWNEIFARYGRPSPFNVGEADTGNKTAAQVLSDNIVDFE